MICRDRGFAGTSLEQIAAAAGVGKHTLYRRFPDKAALFVAALKRHESASPDLQQTHDTQPPLQQLRSLVTTMLNLSVGPRAVQFLRVIIGEGGRFPELGENFLMTGPAVSRAAVGGLILKAQAAGALRPGDLDWPARTLLSMAVGMPLLRHLMGSDEFADPAAQADHMDRVWQMFMDTAGPAGEACSQTAPP